MFDQKLQSLVNEAAAFIGDIIPAAAKLGRGAGTVADILFNIMDVSETAINTVRKSTLFDGMSLIRKISINELQKTMSEMKGNVAKVVTQQYQPDFSPIYGRPTGGALAGFNSTAGTMAEAPNYVMDWVANLKEMSRSENFSDIISFTGHEAKTPYNIFTKAPAETPVTIQADIHDRILEVIFASRAPIITENDIIRTFDVVVDLLQAVTFDETKIPAETPNEYLITLKGTKSVKVLPDETLQSISHRELGSADRWREIAAINDIIIENPLSIYFPVGVFTYSGDLAAGTNYIDFASSWDSEYAEPDCIIEIKDSVGNKQRLGVKSVAGSLVTFRETFSRFFLGPIQMTRYDNRAHYGTYDSSTTLAAASRLIDITLSVIEPKDIYPGYTIRVVETGKSVDYTVKSVNYVAKTVQVNEPIEIHASGSLVEIYDTQNRLCHLEPGIELLVPKATSNQDMGNVVQSPAEVFGTDLTLDSEGEIAFDDNDLKTVTGLENLKQAIKHRIYCPYLGLLFHPEYGCGLWNIVGHKNSPYYETLAKATLIDAMNHEPRINHIAGFAMNATPDSIQIDMVVTPVDEKNPTINLVISGA